MADTKISAAPDIATLVATDMVPVARSGDTSPYHGTLAEVANFVSTTHGGPWLPLAGGTLTGVLTLNGDPHNPLEPVTLQYLNLALGSVTAGVPEAPSDGNAYGRLSAAWARVLPLAGGTLTGPLTLAADPASALQAATRQYVDAHAGGAAIAATAPAAPAAGALWWSTTDGRLYVYTGTAWTDAPGAASLPTATTSVLGAVKPDGTSITITPGGVISAVGGGGGGSGVSSWNTRTGAVTLTAGDVTAVLPPSSTTPAMDGTAAVGTGTTWARADHVHPSDTSRYAASNPSGFQTAAQVSAAVAPALNNVGRNRIHNSGFSVNQRTYVTATALAAGAYGHDRWKAGASGCTYTFTQNQPFTTLTITAGSLQQIIENMAVEGGAYVLSWTGTAQGRVNAGSYGASPVTVTGLPANTAITVEFNTGSLGAVQFEPGSVATPLEKRDPMLELALAERFYQSSRLVFGGYGASAGVATYHSSNLPIQMRGNPTVTPVSPTLTNCGSLNVGTYGNGNSVYMSVTITSVGSFTAIVPYTLSADL